MSDLSNSEDELDQIAELESIKQYVDSQKSAGSKMSVSGWDDDDEGVEVKRNPKTPKEMEMLEAAEYGDLETVRRLTEEDPNLLRTRDLDGYSALHRACYNDHANVVEYLIMAGADVMALTEDHWTPLHSACHWNNAMSAIKLIEGGADVNAVTAGGQSALHLAVSHGTAKDCTEILLMHPLIKSDLCNNAGETPYDIARRSGPYHTLFELQEPCLTSLQNV